MKFNFIWIQLYFDSTMPFFAASYGHPNLEELLFQIVSILNLGGFRVCCHFENDFFLKAKSKRKCFTIIDSKILTVEVFSIWWIQINILTIIDWFTSFNIPKMIIDWFLRKILDLADNLEYDRKRLVLDVFSLVE